MRDLHKYEKTRTRKGRSIWECRVPGCSHSLNREEMIIGKGCVCWNCGQNFVIERMPHGYCRHPVCDACTVTPEGPGKYPYLSKDEYEDLIVEADCIRDPITRMLKIAGFRVDQRAQ